MVSNKDVNTNDLYQTAIGSNRNATNMDSSDYWQRNYNDGSYSHFINGINRGTVYANDSIGRFDTAASAYADQNGGITPTGTINDPTGFSHYTKYMQGSADTQKNAINAQLQAALGTLDTQRDRTNQNFDSAQKALYAQYMQGQKNMGQELAAAGLGKTGMSETTRLAADTNYQGTYSANEKARNDALMDIANQKANLQASTLKNLADLDSNNNQAIANMYMQALQQDQSNMRADRDYYANQRQADSDNALEVANMLMNMNATSPTVLKQLKQLYPDLSTDDMIVYGLNQALAKQNTNNNLAKANKLAQSLNK